MSKESKKPPDDEYDSDVGSLSSISDDSILNSDEDTSLQIKESSTMRERLEIRKRIQDKRKRNDMRKERRYERKLEIKRRKAEKERLRLEEEQRRLENQIPLDEQVVILEKRVKRLERHLDIERKMSTGNRRLVTKLSQKNALLEREAAVLRHLAHQRQVNMLNERQARAKESIYIHKCAYAERELASVKAQAKHFQDEVKRLKGMMLRKDHEIQVLNVGVKSTEQLVRVSEDEAQRKDSCLLDLEKVVEKLASDLSIARRESLEWEIEHKRVEHELLQVQAVLARMIVGNPLATSADRAMVVTHARKRKPARVLQVRTLVDSGQNYRPNSNTMIVAKYDKRKEAELQQQSERSKSVNDMLKSVNKKNHSGNINSRYMAINRNIKSTSALVEQRKHRVRVGNERRILQNEYDNSIVLNENSSYGDIYKKYNNNNVNSDNNNSAAEMPFNNNKAASKDLMQNYATQVENDPSPFTFNENSHEKDKNKHIHHIDRPQSAGPMYLAAFGQTGTDRTLEKKKQIELSQSAKIDDSNSNNTRRPVSATAAFPEKYVPVTIQKGRKYRYKGHNADGYSEDNDESSTQRPISATYSNAPSSIRGPDNVEPSILNGGSDNSRPNSANTFKSFSTLTGNNSRPHSAATDRSNSTKNGMNKKLRPTSATSEDTVNSSDYDQGSGDKDIYDKNALLSATHAPPIHGELSTSGSVLGPLPDITSRNSNNNKRQKRPTSAKLRSSSKLSIDANIHRVDVNTSDGNKNISKRSRPVSAQARTPIRQHRHATKYSSSRFYIDRSDDEAESMNSARSSSTYRDGSSMPTSGSPNTNDGDGSEIASSIGTTHNSEYTDNNNDGNNQYYTNNGSPKSSISTSSSFHSSRHQNVDANTYNNNSDIFRGNTGNSFIVGGNGDSVAASQFQHNISNNTNTFQMEENLLQRRHFRPSSANTNTTSTSFTSNRSNNKGYNNIYNTEKENYPRQDHYHTIQQKYNNMKSNIKLSNDNNNKKGKKGKKKKKGSVKNRIPGNRSKYYGRGLGFRRDNAPVPTVFGGGSSKHLLNKIVKRLDPLSLEAAKKEEGNIKARKGRSFVGKQEKKKGKKDMVF